MNTTLLYLPFSLPWPDYTSCDASVIYTAALERRSVVRAVTLRLGGSGLVSLDYGTIQKLEEKILSSRQTAARSGHGHTLKTPTVRSVLQMPLFTTMRRWWYCSLKVVSFAPSIAFLRGSLAGSRSAYIGIYSLQKAHICICES